MAGTHCHVCEVSMGQYLESAFDIQKILDTHAALKASCGSTVCN